MGHNLGFKNISVLKDFDFYALENIGFLLYLTSVAVYFTFELF